MAKENPGFEVVGGTEVDQPAQPDPNAMAVALITLGIKTLSQRALTAATDLFTLITCAGAFYLWMVTPNPDDKQIISLSIYALFTLAANYIVEEKMKRFLVAFALLVLPCAASAQQTNMYWQTSGTTPCPSCWSPVSAANPLPITGALSIAGTTSNATSGVATSSTNLPTVSYNYGFNGTTWDQIQVDGSKNLKINCITGCAAAGSVSNATSAVATSATNSGVVSYNYGFNGTTWDQLQVDASKNLKTANQTPDVAGENHTGEVGTNGFSITNDMTTTSATTTTGQSIGGLQTLANAVRVSGAVGASGTSGYVQTINVTFTDAIGAGPLDVYFFNANPTGSTCTNDSAFILANADRDKVIGIAHVTDFTSSNTAVVAQANNQSMLYTVASATSIFACVVARTSFVIAGTTNASLVTRVVRN